MTRQLMTHPGFGPLTALAYEVVIGTPERFHCGQQVAGYWGWFEMKSPAAIGVDWDTASGATCCSGFCRGKQRRSR